MSHHASGPDFGFPRGDARLDMTSTAVCLDPAISGFLKCARPQPLQAVFLPGELRESYLNGEPPDDDRFVGVFAHELEHAGGYTNEVARRVARTLLPDILSYDPLQVASFPRNGRTLTDDVVDVFFSMLTNRRVTGDKVGAHNDLLDEFPYLGPPHDSRYARS